MAFAEYENYDALGLGELVRKKKVTALELVDEAISRADKLNLDLNAIIFKAYDQAREAAKSAKPEGAFAGVPTLLKDMRGGCKGMPTRMGSRFMPNMPADHDATLVARFKAEGLIPLGKTNVPEFGILPTTESKLYGPAHNPYDLTRSTGGSSGGSAASVAARIVPIAHATDGGGSIRIPASANGLVGLKVSRGRITQGPDASDSMSGLSVDHVVCHTVRDCAAALDIACVPDYGDPYFALPAEGSYLANHKKKPKRLKIAVSFKMLNGRPHHPDVLDAVKKTAALCEQLGHTVEETSPPISSEVTTPAFLTLWSSNTAMGVDLLTQVFNKPASTDVIEGLTLSLYEHGMTISAVEHMKAQQVLFRAGRTMAQFHETYDVWLGATLGAPPLKLGTINVDEQNILQAFAPIMDYVPFTSLQNATGQPAINVPLQWSKEGLPLGVQFVGRTGAEMLLLQLAAELEEAQPWISHKPKL